MIGIIRNNCLRIQRASSIFVSAHLFLVYRYLKMAEVISNTEDAVAQGDSENKRDRSSIEFPYMSLDDAVELARAVQQHGGSSIEWDTLAASLDQAPKGGAFRLRVSTAKMFGLVSQERSIVALTPLGHRILDPDQERRARYDAFLNIPLYSRIFDVWRGKILPPQAALEREMGKLGVAPKQTDRARQVFMRSAKQANLFEFGHDRLVPPSNLGQPNDNGAMERPNEQLKEEQKSGGGGNGGGLDPLIQGLLARLPKSGEEWPVSARAKWLRIAANAFDLIYGETAEEIDIRLKSSEHH
jgi:hypothetical protein